MVIGLGICGLFLSVCFAGLSVGMEMEPMGEAKISEPDGTVPRDAGKRNLPFQSGVLYQLGARNPYTAQLDTPPPGTVIGATRPEGAGRKDLPQHHTLQCGLSAGRDERIARFPKDGERGSELQPA